jgi:soluble lytic murein transglycosylase-like protein
MTSGIKSFIACLATLLLALPVGGSAETIRRIIHADGTVEFTNVKGGGRQRPSSKDEVVFRYTDDAGVVSYSSVEPSDADFEVIRFACYACDPDSSVNWRTTPLFLKPYGPEIKAAATRFQVDPALVRAVIHAESAFNAKAISPKGAQGLMQLMPTTARELGVQDAQAPPQNIRGGVDYLARMLRQFDGDITLATAAYNAGPGAVSRYGGVPPYAETRAYVERVGILHERYAAR